MLWCVHLTVDVNAETSQEAEDIVDGCLLPILDEDIISWNIDDVVSSAALDELQKLAEKLTDKGRTPKNKKC